MKRVVVNTVVAAMMVASCGGGSHDAVRGKLTGKAASGSQIQISFGKEVKATAIVEDGAFTIALPVPDGQSLSEYKPENAKVTPQDVKSMSASFALASDDYPPLMCIGKKGFAQYVYVDKDVHVRYSNKSEIQLFRGWNTIVNHYEGKLKWRQAVEPLPDDFSWVLVEEGLDALKAMVDPSGCDYEAPGWFDGTITGRLDENTRKKVKTVKAVAQRMDYSWATFTTARATDGHFSLSLPAPNERDLTDLMRISLFSPAPKGTLTVTPENLRLVELSLRSETDHPIHSIIPQGVVYFLYANMDASIKRGYTTRGFDICLKKGWNVVILRKRMSETSDIVIAEPMPDNIIWKTSY